MGSRFDIPASTDNAAVAAAAAASQLAADLATVNGAATPAVAGEDLAGAVALIEAQSEAAGAAAANAAMKAQLLNGTLELPAYTPSYGVGSYTWSGGNTARTITLGTVEIAVGPDGDIELGVDVAATIAALADYIDQAEGLPGAPTTGVADGIITLTSTEAGTAGNYAIISSEVGDTCVDATGGEDPPVTGLDVADIVGAEGSLGAGSVQILGVDGEYDSTIAIGMTAVAIYADESESEPLLLDEYAFGDDEMHVNLLFGSAPPHGPAKLITRIELRPTEYAYDWSQSGFRVFATVLFQGG